MIKITTIFGEDAVREYEENNELPSEEWLADNGGVVDEKEFDRVEAIIRSMTPKERRRPEIINGSRRQRIAAGCGMRVQDVNKLLKNFEDSKKMMKKMQGMSKFASKGGVKLPFMH